MKIFHAGHYMSRLRCRLEGRGGRIDDTKHRVKKSVFVVEQEI